MKTQEANSVNHVTPNICYVIDSNGKHWICPVGVDTNSSLETQACFAADETIYDRMFGG
jgi:hypothetical protein